jgi:hypothetical protein
MWKSSLFPIFIFVLSVLLFLAPPTYAISHLGEASVDWNSLKFSGVPVTVTDMFQRHSIDSSASLSRAVEFQEWRDHTLTQTVPQFATLRNSADADWLYASINTFGSGEGFTSVERGGRITPLETGDLTVSIDYTLSHSGVPSSQDNFNSLAIVDLTFQRDEGTALGSELGDGILAGTLSRPAPVKSGESLFFGIRVGADTRSVPLPDMLWPTLAGMLGIAFWAERKRRHERLMR